MIIKEVEFSSMNIFPPIGAEDDFLQAFTKRHQTKANLLQMDWGDAWNQLVRFGLNSHGPDVSEIGTTWLGGLHSMDALRPFTPAETAKWGEPDLFLPASWKACQFGRNNLTMAIPFILDVRVVLYRRDWLQKAGVDEATAFMDSDHFLDTLKSLKAAGCSSPLGIPTSHSYTRLIHDLACWVWSAGGDIRSNDGRRMLLLEAKSRAGMQAYFALNEFISPEMQALAEDTLFDAFAQGKCAVAISSERSYLGLLTEDLNISPEVKENIGVAMLMQTPFVGGTGLAIWRYSHNYQEALKLVQYLTSLEAWQFLNKQGIPFTPARRDALAQSPLAATPFYPAIEKSLQNGRSFQSGFRWSGVESRLVVVIENLWEDLRTNPELNIAHEIEQRFSSVCKRLEETILVS